MQISIGDRVRIYESDSVCAYLHGHTGVVESVRDDIKTVNGICYRIELDVPAWCGAKGFTPLDSIGLTRDCFGPSVLKNKSSEISRTFQEEVSDE